MNTVCFRVAVISMLFCWLEIGTSVHAQQPHLRVPNGRDAPVPRRALRLNNAFSALTDTTVKVGKLTNGLTFYIKKNALPKNRAEFRLIVRAGSILEDSSQRGIAHFVEHMAFNGTRNFKKNEIVDFLEKSGVRFGADLNASTSFDETTYQLSIPTDSTQLLNRAFDILGDWADGVTFDNAEMERERNVVMEEWRLGRGASARLRERYLPQILGGSRYSRRLPIGTPSSIASFTGEAAKRFYHDWYRPDLMALVAVGDFDIPRIERLIKTHFDSIKNPADEKIRTYFTIPENKKPIVFVGTDQEQTYTTAQLFYKQPRSADKTDDDLRNRIVRRLFILMMNERVKSLQEQEKPPFLFGAFNYSRFMGDRDAYSGFAVSPNGSSLSGALEGLIVENARVEKYGFSITELERAKKTVLDQEANAFLNKDKTNSKEYLAAIINNFLYQYSIRAVASEFDFYQKILPGISLNEVTQMAHQWIRDEGRMLVVTAPEKEKKSLPDATQLKKMLDGPTKSILSYNDHVPKGPLVDHVPLKKPVQKTDRNELLDITTWHFENGATVMLKPTDYQDNQILFSGSSPGGTSAFSDSLFTDADHAAEVTAQSGAGRFSSVQMQKFLAGKSASLAPYINSYRQGFMGRSSKKDLQTVLQWMYLYFTQPRTDSLAFKSFIEREISSVQNRSLDPGAVFADAVTDFMSGRNKRELPPTVDDIKKITLIKTNAAFKKAFSKPGNFTFCLVGSFKLSEVKALVETYIGGLPASRSDDSWKDDLNDYPAGIVKRVIKKGKDQKSQVRIIFTGNIAYTPLLNTQLDFLMECLRIKLRENLREDKGGTYGVGAYGEASKLPRQRYRITVSFACSPENTDRLIKGAQEEIFKMQHDGPDATTLAKVKAENVREHEVSARQNEYWFGEMNEAVELEETVDHIPEKIKTVVDLSIADTKKLAQQFFGSGNAATFVLMPE